MPKKKIEINKQESLEKKIKIVWSFSNSRRSFLTTFEHNAWRQVRVSRALTSFVFAGKLANRRRSPAILPDSREIGLFFLFLFCFLFIIIIPELLQGKFLRIFILFCCKLCVILMIFGIVGEIEFFINVFSFSYLFTYLFFGTSAIKISLLWYVYGYISNRFNLVSTETEQRIFKSVGVIYFQAIRWNLWILCIELKLCDDVILQKEILI